MSILEVNNVSKSFGGVKANVDISMSVEKGKIFGLIGPNGSGKTTLFNSIVGTYPIDQGSIKFNGNEDHFQNMFYEIFKNYNKLSFQNYHRQRISNQIKLINTLSSIK